MTSKVTRDIIQSEIADFFAGVVEIHTELGGPNTVEEAQNQLTDRVLACVPEVDSEPVFTLEVSQAGYKGQKLGNHFGFITLDAARNLKEGNYQLYRHAQPAPVVPEEATTENIQVISGALIPRNGGWYKMDENECHMAVDVWNACRAAMLQAGALTNEDTKQAWTGIPDIDNAINMLDRIDTLESCDDDRIEAVKTVLRGLAGNSPVITDSSAEMLRRWLAFGRGMQNAGSQLPHNLIAETESMLAAAPHDTPALNSVQSVVTVPGKWIPVSERMPDVGVKVLCFPVEDEPIHAVFNGQLWLQDVSWSGSYEPIDNVIPVTVTHWMPLPAGPQGVKGE